MAANVNGNDIVPLTVVAEPDAPPVKLTVTTAGFLTLKADNAAFTYCVVATFVESSLVDTVGAVNDTNEPTELPEIVTLDAVSVFASINDPDKDTNEAIELPCIVTLDAVNV